MQHYIKLITTSGGTQSDAWELLCHATKLSRTELIIKNTAQLTPVQHQQITHAINKYLVHNIPVGYITGSIVFNNLEIQCEPPILIPRPETEEWVAQLITEIKALANKAPVPLEILDLCTGTGCIGLALAHALPTVRVTVADNNPRALALAQKNIITLGLSHRVTAVLSNIYSTFEGKKFDIIVANPPYIPENTVLEPSVSQWEDPQALFAGFHGLDIITPIIQDARKFLTPSIHNNIPCLILECDITHAEVVKNLYKQAGFTRVKIQHDLAKKPRSVWGYHMSYTK